MSERNLKDANFVFSGGSTGIGHAAALEVARRGASVLIIGRNAKAGAAAIAALKAAGAPSADFAAADLSTLAGMTQAADAAKAWKPSLHGLMHTAMSPLSAKRTTPDGFEFAFALQYMARATLNRLLADRLAASGDGRIVHIAGNVPGFIKPDLDDLQFERRKWSFYAAVLGTHVLGYLHVQEAARRWADRPIAASVSCVGPTRTPVMNDPSMPLSMRMMLPFAATPAQSARNAVRLLTQDDVSPARGAILRNPKAFTAKPLALNAQQAERLWRITTELAAQKGLALPG